jgi:L-fuculose-phosphate aldolase
MRAKLSSPNHTNGVSERTLGSADPRLFSSPEADEIKREICEAGKKLWLRQYVDGNGGNISYRIGPNEVICTPTQLSKYDLKPDDLCMVDLEGRQVAGTKKSTSEILLHLEIYKEVAEAKSVVHCHPPHATAYAITRAAPPNLCIPEFEVFVGRVAVAPYKTPGTKEFAETVLPYVREHNTILLASHGVVCWGDTVTHAEWYAEVLETYCWTVMLAAQLASPVCHFDEQETADLIAFRKRLGVQPDMLLDAALKHNGLCANLRQPVSTVNAAEIDVEALVRKITDSVLKELGAK